MDKNFERINIRGVYFDNVDFNSAFQKVMAAVRSDGVSVMFTPNSEIVQGCIDNPSLYPVINSADIIIPDGIGVIYASKVLKTPLKQKVAGCEIAQKLLEYASVTCDGIFLFGGAKNYEGELSVAEVAARNLRKKYPRLNICGARDGFFTDDDNNDIINEINSSGAKILFVCLGAPKQELWIHKNKDKLKVNFAAGLGGSIDVFAGKATRAPDFFIDHNIEWLYRFAKNPSRYKRMALLPKFLLGTIIHKNKGC